MFLRHNWTNQWNFWANIAVCWYPGCLGSFFVIVLMLVRRAGFCLSYKLLPSISNMILYLNLQFLYLFNDFSLWELFLVGFGSATLDFSHDLHLVFVICVPVYFLFFICDTCCHQFQASTLCKSIIRHVMWMI